MKGIDERLLLTSNGILFVIPNLRTNLPDKNTGKNQSEIYKQSNITLAYQEFGTKRRLLVYSAHGRRSRSVSPLISISRGCQPCFPTNVPTAVRPYRYAA